MRDFGIQ